MIIILILSITLFIVSNLLIAFSLFFILQNSNNLQHNKIKFSIVISAKNEEENIVRLIHSLSELDYPQNQFEVIILDDNSTDKTFQIVTETIKSKTNFSLFSANNKSLPGKKGALTIGIQNAKNPFIMITDADCVVEKQWLSSFATKFEVGYDFVLGGINFYQSKSMVNNISCFEKLRTSILTFGFAGLGLPYSAGGASFGFRKNAFNKINGYQNTTETLSGDDDLLIREAVKNKLKIGTVTNRKAFVHSSTKDNFKDYFNQKARHTTTSNFYLWRHKFILALWHFMNLLFLFSPFLAFVDWSYIIFFLVKLIIDEITVISFADKFGYKFKPYQIFYLQIEYEIFLIFHYLNATFKKKIEWK
ncbi:MAG: glycosyltransferase [Ignavibacteriales bacterium]|nr:glycosyltransferase [Ignavibacteriales bacterium]